MSRCLMLGMTNVGKTCFTLNFAEYLGLHEVEMTIKQPAGYKTTYTYGLNAAREELISPHPNKTCSLYSLDLVLPLGKGKGRLTLIDSCGLSDGIHPNEEVRRAMAQTIGKIKESDIILHMIDLKALLHSKEMKISIIDAMIRQYVHPPQAYAVLANKIDLQGTNLSLESLRQQLKKVLIIPTSALYQRGFREVKSFVWRNL